MDTLQGLGMGIIGLAIIIGVGVLVLTQFGGAVANCETGFSWNQSTDLCWNGTDTATPTGAGWTNLNYLEGQLGSTGLAGWVPAIIAISVGLLFLGAFMLRGRSF